MLPRTAILALMLVLATVLAGCHAPDDEGGEDGDVTTTPTLTPANTSAPEGRVDSVTITRAPTAEVGAGDNVTICWRVEGEGTIPHTAIHWDNESHANETEATFQAYDQGARYPDNQTQAATSGYMIPAQFCTEFPMPDEDTYVIGHAFAKDAAPGMISDEAHIISLA